MIRINIQIEEMFDQQDYYSDEEENLQYSKHFSTGKALLPNSGSDFNHLTGEGESLMKMMKERGLDFNANEVKKLKNNNNNREKQMVKPKAKAGFMDGGASASYEQLLKALNKALANADPQQASVVLSHILERKTLSPAERNKFGIMKCKILFGLGAYQDCESKAEALLQKGIDDHLVAASLSNYLAKSRAELNRILEGYMDFLRAKAHIEKQRITNPPIDTNEKDEFADSELDTVTRQIEHTQMELNFRMNKYKNATNLVHPYFNQFRHQQVLQVACGDYHSLFLVGGPLGVQTSNEVFGIGQNSVGQILGRSSMSILKEPTLLVELSNKKIKGLAANRESSCAWDEKGCIYEWGIKQKRDEQINITYNLGEKIIHFEKGYQQYAALGESGKFYTWGNIFFKGTPIIRQQKPTVQPGQNIVSFSCGNNHVTAVDKYGDMFVFGSNQCGQLGIEGQLHAKTFKKLNNVWLGPVRKTFCLADTTFIVTRDEEVFFCGKISHQKENIEKPRQGQFSGDIDYVTSIAGTINNYYLTTAGGELYHWDVDTSVKFKIEKENEKVPQRIVQYSRGNLWKIRSLVVPELTRVKQLTQSPCSYEDIQFQVELFDQHGPFSSSSFVLPPRCQIFLSTYAIKADELLKENKLFLESCQFSVEDSKVLLNEIVESRLVGMKMVRNQQYPSRHKMIINSDESGKFYFYVVMEEKIVYAHELKITVSQRQKELSEKNKREKELREEERKRKAEIQRQRLLQEKLKRENEQEQRRRQTQKRAEEAFKKHMRQQEELKMRAEEDRRAKKDLLTGGGFDLNKMRAKNQRMVEKQEIIEKSSELSQKTPDLMTKTGQSFLPDINARPGSRRKVNLPSKNSFNMTSFDSVKGGGVDRPPSRKEQLGGTGVNLFKSESTKEKEIKPTQASSKAIQGLNKTSTGGRVIVKRGLSKGRK